jgi:hypothetical protein
MVTLSPDTAAEIERMQIEHLRRLPASRKLTLVGEMNRTVQAMALAGLRQRYPDDTQEQRRRRLAALLLGSELATRAYGPGPEEA